VVPVMLCEHRDRGTYRGWAHAATHPLCNTQGDCFLLPRMPVAAGEGRFDTQRIAASANAGNCRLLQVGPGLCLWLAHLEFQHALLLLEQLLCTVTQLHDLISLRGHTPSMFVRQGQQYIGRQSQAAQWKGLLMCCLLSSLPRRGGPKMCMKTSRQELLTSWQRGMWIHSCSVFDIEKCYRPKSLLTPC
jgi:hypothetical protein